VVVEQESPDGDRAGVGTFQVLSKIGDGSFYLIEELRHLRYLGLLTTSWQVMILMLKTPLGKERGSSMLHSDSETPISCHGKLERNWWSDLHEMR